MLAVIHGDGKRIIRMDMMNKEEIIMSEFQKISIEHKAGTSFGLLWKHNKGDKALANVIIMTGMEETSRRYDEFAKYLNNEGFDVYCIDSFGQGENVLPDLSNLGVWPKSGFRKQVQVVDALVQKLRITCLPTFIFSHSMGSFLAQDYIQRYTHHVSKVVLCGSNGKNPATGVGYLLAKMVVTKKNAYEKAKLLNKLMFGNFNKGIKNPRTPYDWLSFNEENVDRYIADPLCGFGPNNSFCLEFLKGLNRLYKRKFLEKIRKDLDIFIISGEGDPVSNFGKGVTALEKMYAKKLKLKSVKSKIYPNMRHEILQEKEREIVFKDIADFFKADLEKKNIV